MRVVMCTYCGLLWDFVGDDSAEKAWETKRRHERHGDPHHCIVLIEEKFDGGPSESTREEQPK